MVGHQHAGMDRNIVPPGGVAQGAEIGDPVVFISKRRSAIVAAMGDVQWNPGYVESGTSHRLIHDQVTDHETLPRRLTVGTRLTRVCESSIQTDLFSDPLFVRRSAVQDRANDLDQALVPLDDVPRRLGP
jgi:hypothetical protein